MELQFDYWPISRLKPDARNAKLHTTAQIEAICKSIREIGFADPIGVEPDGLIVEGHGRYAAARSLGIDTVPVIVLNGLSEEQRRAYALIHNKLTMDTGFDMDKLRMELEAIKSIDMSAFDFSFDFDFAAVEEGGGSSEALDESTDDESTDYEAVAEAIEEPKVKQGQIWQLGRHRLMCGDATAPEQVAELMAGEEADLLLTDPPYCSGASQESGKSAGSIGSDGRRWGGNYRMANDMLSTRGYQKLIRSAISLSNAVSAYVFTDWRMWIYLHDLLEDRGFHVRNMIVWNKGTPGMGVGWRSQHELVAYGIKMRPTIDKHVCQGNVITCKRSGNPDHPTQKPVELIETLLKVVKYDKVYDPFAGSGTTLIACERLGLESWCMEMEPRFCDVIIRRWEAMTGKEAVQVK